MPHSTTVTLTPVQRRQELAAIFGRGLLRLGSANENHTVAGDSAPKTTDQKALDVSAPGDPHVSWLTQPRT